MPKVSEAWRSDCGFTAEHPRIATILLVGLFTPGDVRKGLSSFQHGRDVGCERATVRAVGKFSLPIDGDVDSGGVEVESTSSDPWEPE